MDTDFLVIQGALLSNYMVATGEDMHVWWDVNSLWPGDAIYGDIDQGQHWFR